MNTRLTLRPSTLTVTVRRLTAPALAAALIALLAALPTGSAAAGAPRIATPSLASLPGVSTLPTGELEELLSAIPLGASGLPVSELEVPQLAKLLAGLPGIGGLAGLPGLGGLSGLEATIKNAIEELAAHGGKIGELLSSGLSSKLEEGLETALGLPLKPLVETLLKSSPGAILGEGLGSLDVSELLSKLLGAAGQPTQLLDKLFEAINPEALSTLLGTALSGPLSNLNVGELAGGLGVAPEALAEGLGQLPETLPATAKALTAPLASGQTLGLFNGLENLTLGLLPGSKGTPGGSGSNGSNGANGSSGGGTTTISITTPTSATQPSSPAAAGAAAAAAGARVKILSRRIRGHVLTVLVQAPGAGTLALGGNGVRSVSRETARSERATLRTTLTKASAASLSRHPHRRLKFTLKVSFKPITGAGSTATTAVSAG